ncbi:hypothetical protein BLA29_014664, partial [Euroglyphus maynei]
MGRRNEQKINSVLRHSVYEEEEKKKGKNRMKLTLDPLLSWGTKVIHEKN